MLPIGWFTFNHLYLVFATGCVVLFQWEDIRLGLKPVTFWRVVWSLLGNIVAISWATCIWAILSR